MFRGILAAQGGVVVHDASIAPPRFGKRLRLYLADKDAAMAQMDQEGKMDITQVDAYNEEVARQRAQRDADYSEYEKAGRIWGLVPRERITKIRFERVP